MDNHDFGALTLEQQFQLRQMEDAIDSMNLEQARKTLKDVLKRSMYVENMYKSFIRQGMFKDINIGTQNIQL